MRHHWRRDLGLNPAKFGLERGAGVRARVWAAHGYTLSVEENRAKRPPAKVALVK
jgi:hypothetical protein